VDFYCKKFLILVLIVSTPANAVAYDCRKRLLVGAAIVFGRGVAMVYYGADDPERGDTGLLLCLYSSIAMIFAGVDVVPAYLDKKMIWMVKEDALNKYNKLRKNH